MNQALNLGVGTLIAEFENKKSSWEILVNLSPRWLKLHTMFVGIIVLRYDKYRVL